VFLKYLFDKYYACFPRATGTPHSFLAVSAIDFFLSQIYTMAGVLIKWFCVFAPLRLCVNLFAPTFVLFVPLW
jgi:hypothetical protein